MTVPDVWPEPALGDRCWLIPPTVLRDSHRDVNPDRLANNAARKRLSELLPDH
ncbi:hypothetical protein [Kitasatospora sp. NPDC002965]|uniref:hypothetical protein n=1 Tax=Kitasatospora sp. NPDC002965 TaxID=3154775 RepID=UPI0033BBBD86